MDSELCTLFPNRFQNIGCQFRSLLWLLLPFPLLSQLSIVFEMLLKSDHGYFQCSLEVVFWLLRLLREFTIETMNA